MRWALSVVALFVLLVACTSETADVASPVVQAAPSDAAAPTTPTPERCPSLRVSLETADQSVQVAPSSGPVAITVKTDDVIRVRVAGTCSASIGFGLKPGTFRYVRHRADRRLRPAVRPVRAGTALLDVTIPMCAGRQDESCRGGIGVLTTVTVTVQDSNI